MNIKRTQNRSQPFTCSLFIHTSWTILLDLLFSFVTYGDFLGAFPVLLQKLENSFWGQAEEICGCCCCHSVPSEGKSKESYPREGAARTQARAEDVGESSEQWERSCSFQTLKRGAKSNGSTYNQMQPEEERHTKRIIPETAEKCAVVEDSAAENRYLKDEAVWVPSFLHRESGWG